MKTPWRNNALFSSAALLLVLGTGRINGADYPTTVQSFNPVAYWRLSETTPVPRANTITNFGTLGAAANGFVVSNAVNGFPGIVGTCLQFTNIYPASDANQILNCGSKVDVPYNIALNP